MLWGWDATESKAYSYMKKTEDEDGEDILVPTYEFTAAAYRNFFNAYSEIQQIRPSPLGDN